MPCRRPVIRCVPLAVAAAMIVTACGDRSGKSLDDPVFPPPATEAPATTVPATVAVPAPFTLVAPWVDGAAVPDRHTCAGAGASPALSWSGVPAGTTELAVTVVDTDADRFVHWLVYALSPIETGLVEAQPPVGGFEWPNSAGEAGWEPLCPPTGETHRYEFTVHALNQQLEVADDASAAEVLSILNATTIARATVVGIATGA